MRRKKYFRVTGMLLLICCIIIAIPQRLKAASWTGQETEITLIGSKVGRYQMNYTGNTNHYAYWNSQGTAFEVNTNYIYNDVPGWSNSSTAALSRTPGATGIKYAYLVWETRSPAGATEPIVLITPDGRRGSISPTYAINDWREDTTNGFWAYRSLYCMATDVTAIVQSSGYGNYSVCNIPRYNGGSGGGESPGSWQLIVVEEGDDFPVSTVCLSMGAKFKMAENYYGELSLTNGLKSKITGAAGGQVFFGASNSSNNAPMTENITTYTGAGVPIKQAVSNTTTSPGLYRNGRSQNGRDSSYGCIRMSLSDVGDIGNGAEKIGLTVNNQSWSSFFFLGLAMDIAYPDFVGEQVTTVNSASSVTLTGRFTNTAPIQNTGIYNGNLVVELDSGLTPVSASAVVNGATSIGGSISGRTVTFSGPAVASMMNGSNISYKVQCTTGNSGKTVFNNSAGFHGYLRSDSVNTGYWIDRMWTASSSAVPKYTLTLNKGTGISSVSGAGDYTYGSAVNISAAITPGYHWTSWTGDYSTAQQNFYFTMTANNLSMTANAEAVIYTIQFDGNGATGGGTAAMSCYCDRDYNLNRNGFLRTGYTFAGWNTQANGTGTAYTDGQSIRNLTLENGKTVVLYAQWKPNTYTVRYDGNGADGGSMADSQHTYDIAKNLSRNSYTKTGYTFLGWNRNQDGTGEGFSDGQSVKNLTAENHGVVTLYAQWRPNKYTIVFDPNGGAGHMDDIQTQYDTDVTLPNGADAYKKYTLDGVNVTDAVISGGYTFSIFSEELEEEEEGSENPEDPEDPKAQTGEPEGPETDETPEEETEAKEEEADMDQEVIEALPDDPEGVEALEGDEEAVERSVLVQRAYPSVFMGWSLADRKNSFIPQWRAGDTVRNLTAEDNGVVTLYAVWDDCPWIQAQDLYYSLEQAQNGFITELEILSHATASDREDGSPIDSGFHDNGTSFSIPDYQESDFTQFRKEGSVTENLTVVDSVGSVYSKQITVHIVDTTPTVVEPEGTTRFIDEKYYKASYENGGLEDNSIWKTDPEYRAVLEKSFDNLRNDTPVEEYHFTREDILEMKQFIEENGVGNSKRPDALSDFYEKFMVPNRIK